MFRQNFPKTLKPNCLLTRYPVCFLHGLKSILNFHDYWRGIPEYIGAHGYEVFELRSRWRGPNDLRVQLFTDQLLKILQRAPKVHIIAHSLGTLNSLEIAQDPRLKDRIASLTWISPPFRGSPWAKLGLIGKWGTFDLFASTNQTLIEQAAQKKVSAFENFYGSQEHKSQGPDSQTHRPFPIFSFFSQTTPQNGRAPQLLLQGLLLTSYLKHKGQDGANDGLVTMASQREAQKFCQWSEVFPGDHMQVIGGKPWPPLLKTSHERFLEHCIFLAERDLKSAK